jgi:transcriptional regulator with XRE-family HTH domain
MLDNTNSILTNDDITSTMNDKEILAQNIAFFRKKMNMSQTELAKKIEYSNKNVSKWELGETTPDIFTLKKLASIFNISIDTLVNPITSENKKAIKTKSVVPFRWKVYMLFMVNAILILLGCIAFFVLKLIDFKTFPIGYIFIFLLPIIDLSVFIFICCTKKRVDIISLSLFGWLVVLCFYLAFINFPNIAYVFMIGLGWQILAPLVAMLINSGKIIKLNKLIIKKVKNKKD